MKSEESMNKEELDSLYLLKTNLLLKTLFKLKTQLKNILETSHFQITLFCSKLKIHLISNNKLLRHMNKLTKLVCWKTPLIFLKNQKVIKRKMFPFLQLNKRSHKKFLFETRLNSNYKQEDKLK